MLMQKCRLPCRSFNVERMQRSGSRQLSRMVRQLLISSLSLLQVQSGSVQLCLMGSLDAACHVALTDTDGKSDLYSMCSISSMGVCEQRCCMSGLIRAIYCCTS